MPAATARPYYPIIYLRGFAATMNEIEATTADPYMGFNLGSAMIRQDSEGVAHPFIFESPLLRLIKDHGYTDAFQNGGIDYADKLAPVRSIWIYRYYESVSKSLGSSRRRSMEDFAIGLRAFIVRVRDTICGNDPQARENFRVHLVAHSMGGLICRTYLQNTCCHGLTEAEMKAAGHTAKDLDVSAGKPFEPLVDKVFTYGTPHNGIDFLGFNVPDLGSFDRLQISNFDRERMREYLRLKGTQAVNDLHGAFPASRFFCLIGSNYRDYEAFFGLSKKGTGPSSDGLVMMENAYVKDAPRAVISRSHSGAYGIVNSEAGYQNLRRFLFGDYQVTVTLEVEDLPLPTDIQKKKDQGKTIGGIYHFDVSARVRNGPNYSLHERRYDQASALMEKYDDIKERKKSIYLFTGYLLKDARGKDAHDLALVFTLDLGVHVPAFEVDHKFWFDGYAEGFSYRDTLTIAVRDKSVKYGFTSKHGQLSAPEIAEQKELVNGAREIRIEVGTGPNVRPGFMGTLVIRVEPWEG
ncbi:hypothetical protein SAMN05216600_10651 [Pseudomonas cuatrocienegasensis]|uniref:PGAP1-like protein n=1 Tax=Pseudomonas cuatrocienegasensis TaxID=543360 RepID=A0ABY1BBL4_9PSED|nr:MULTISPECIES: hypothetical protein [Pseudomonas]OEC32712.1 hypothetical protein A7D25_22745 [Pseudomonas sp. 21C1]SEQ45732.1 hypothetical protein SAMN05216600_10651 [Pseudomonas cuatrocienegasensis]